MFRVQNAWQLRAALRVLQEIAPAVDIILRDAVTLFAANGMMSGEVTLEVCARGRASCTLDLASVLNALRHVEKTTPARFEFADAFCLLTVGETTTRLPCESLNNPRAMRVNEPKASAEVGAQQLQTCVKAIGAETCVVKITDGRLAFDSVKILPAGTMGEGELKLCTRFLLQLLGPVSASARVVLYKNLLAVEAPMEFGRAHFFLASQDV